MQIYFMTYFYGLISTTVCSTIKAKFHYAYLVRSWSQTVSKLVSDQLA